MIHSINTKMLVNGFERLHKSRLLFEILPKLGWICIHRFAKRQRRLARCCYLYNWSIRGAQSYHWWSYWICSQDSRRNNKNSTTADSRFNSASSGKGSMRHRLCHISSVTALKLKVKKFWNLTQIEVFWCILWSKSKDSRVGFFDRLKIKSDVENSDTHNTTTVSLCIRGCKTKVRY